MRENMRRLLYELPAAMREPYIGSRDQRGEARLWSSKMIGRYVRVAILLREPTEDNPKVVEIRPNAQQEVTFLKAFTRRYVLSNPALAAQQQGQRLIIRELFETLMEIVRTGDIASQALPVRWREEAQKARRADGNVANAQLALVADFIASLTEQETIAFHRRLLGTDAGSVLNPIIR